MPRSDFKSATEPHFGGGSIPIRCRRFARLCRVTGLRAFAVGAFGFTCYSLSLGSAPALRSPQFGRQAQSGAQPGMVNVKHLDRSPL
jgi:hypothetical protein